MWRVYCLFRLQPVQSIYICFSVSISQKINTVVVPQHKSFKCQEWLKGLVSLIIKLCEELEKAKHISYFFFYHPCHLYISLFRNNPYSLIKPKILKKQNKKKTWREYIWPTQKHMDNKNKTNKTRDQTTSSNTEQEHHRRSFLHAAIKLYNCNLLNHCLPHTSIQYFAVN